MKNKHFTIAFLGTDGSGKTTIIDAITPKLEEKYGMKVHYEHLRPNHLPSLAVAMGKRSRREEAERGPVLDPHSLPPSSFAGSLFRLSYYMLDYTWGYFRKVSSSKGIIWFFDRYFYDYYIDQRRSRLNLPKWILKLYGYFVPAPNLTICLGADPEKIYARKPETSLEEVQRQVNILKSFCKKNKRAVWIDTGTSIEKSVENTLIEIAKIIK